MTNLTNFPKMPGLDSTRVYMANPATSRKAPGPEQIFTGFGMRESVRRRATLALIRLVEERVGKAVKAASVALTRAKAPRYPPASLGGGAQRAELEGQRMKRDILAAPGMLAPARAAQEAGISRQALDLRRIKGHALALSHQKRGFRYPAWQFDQDIAGTVTRALPELAYLDAWGRYFFFIEPEPLLDGKTPLEVLRSGEHERVLKTIQVLRADEAA